VPVCDLYINSLFNIGNKPLICDKLVDLIYDNADKKLSAKWITEYLEG
jgi:hypothetical protein